jgi:glycosyltransferase involved in cell wall biosynthesis
MSINAIHVVPSISNESSGPSYSVVNLCRSLLESDVATTLVTLEGPRSSNKSAMIKSFPCSGYPMRLGRSPQMRDWLNKVSKDGSIDIMHNHSLWMMPNVYSCNAVKNTNVPLIVSPRGTMSERAMSNGSKSKKLFWPLIQRPALDQVTCFHATAMSEYEDIRRMGFQQPVAVVPNGIDIPDIRTPLRGDMRTLLYLGRIHPIKGLDHLLQAWAAVQDRFKQWQLRIVGPDNKGYLSEMKQLAVKLKLERIEFSGPLTGDKKMEAYAKADLFVLPSYSENFGMTVAESLASGTPAIVTQGAPWSGLNDINAGWWIDIGIDPLVVCLEHALAQTRTSLKTLGLNGRRWMASDFSWRNIADEMKSTYDWIVKGGSKPDCVIDN